MTVGTTIKRFFLEWKENRNIRQSLKDEKRFTESRLRVIARGHSVDHTHIPTEWAAAELRRRRK